MAAHSGHWSQLVAQGSISFLYKVKDEQFYSVDGFKTFAYEYGMSNKRIQEGKAYRPLLLFYFNI